MNQGSVRSPTPRDLRIDNVKIVEDAKCEEKGGFINGDFSDNDLGWLEDRQNPASRFSYLQENGDKFVSISGAGCSGALRQSVYLPDDGSFNAVEYTYRLGDIDDSLADIYLIGLHSIATQVIAEDLPTTSGNFITQRTCIPRQAFGRPWRISLRSCARVRASSPCREFGPRSPENIDFSALELVNTPTYL